MSWSDTTKKIDDVALYQVQNDKKKLNNYYKYGKRKRLRSLFVGMV